MKEIVDEITAEVPQVATELEDKEDEERGYDIIYYRGDVYVHASGMMFNTKKRYCTWVSNRDENFRGLCYYLPNKDGMHKLAVQGDIDANIREVLNVRDWDRNAIYI